MKLKVLLPTEVLLETETDRVVADTAAGSMGILPRRIDFTEALVPGIIAYDNPEGQERYIAVDEGLMVKQGDKLIISTFHAAEGDKLGELEKTLREQFEKLDEHEKRARSKLALIEGDVVKKFHQMSKMQYE